MMLFNPPSPFIGGVNLLKIRSVLPLPQTQKGKINKKKQEKKNLPCYNTFPTPKNEPKSNQGQS